MLAYCYQVGEGNIDHNYWIAPDLQNTTALLDFARPAYFATVESPASDMCAGSAAALAIASLRFRETEPEYAEECRKAAFALYDFAVETHLEGEDNVVLSLGYDGGFYDSSYDYDELAWAAVWLYELTLVEDPTATEEAWEYIDAIIHVDESVSSEMGAYPYTGYLKRIIADTGNCWQNIWVHCWDTVWGGVFAKLAPITNLQRDWYIFRWNLEYWSGLTHLDPGQDDTVWNKEYVADSQLLDTQDTTYLAKTPAGFSMLNEYGSARYNTAAQLCALVYAKYSPETENDPMRFAAWAKSQMEYIMGKNPMNRPYIVGYSETAASHPHHRAAHGSLTLSMDDPETQTHVLWGALVGGSDSDDWYRDITKDYIYNEVAVDYNVAVVGACAGLYTYYGTDEMSNEPNFPPKEIDMKGEIEEFTLKAAVGQEDNMATQVLIALCNQTSQPPRYLDEIRARYYFSIAELLANGQTLDNVEVRIDYDSMKSDTDGAYQVTYEIVQYNDAGDCYIELVWPDYQFYGTVQFQFALMATTQNDAYTFIWDPTDDYSRIPLHTADELGVPLNEAPELTETITMYVEGEHVWGVAPNGSDSGTVSDMTYGDVDCNGSITIADAVLLSRFIAEDTNVTLTDQGRENADCVNDDVILYSDIQMVLRYLSNQILQDELGK